MLEIANLLLLFTPATSTYIATESFFTTQHLKGHVYPPLIFIRNKNRTERFLPLAYKFCAAKGRHLQKAGAKRIKAHDTAILVISTRICLLAQHRSTQQALRQETARHFQQHPQSGKRSKDPKLHQARQAP
jgi:hypothetical protein